MRRGYMYIQEAVPTGLHETEAAVSAQVAQQAVTIDLSAGVAGLQSIKTCYGWAYSKTAEHLGLTSSTEPPSDGMWGRLRVEGTVEDIRANTTNLGRHIGLIARYGSELSDGYSPSNDREWIGRMLGGLTQRVLPELPENTSLMRAVGLIAEPFASALVDDGMSVHYARSRNTVVQDDDGRPLGPFSVRDIGGLEVGPDGLKAPNKIPLTLKLPKNDLKDIRALAEVRESGVGIELGNALGGYLNDSDRPAIESDEDVDATRFSISFLRTDLEKTRELVLGIEGIKMSDVVRTAVKVYIESLDPETRQQVTEERERSEAAQRQLLAVFNIPVRQQTKSGASSQ